MNVLAALDDPKLLGCGVFADPKPWSAWRIFLAAIYGLPLIGDELDLFQQCTGRSEYNPPPGGWPEVVCIVGRQAGKTRLASTLVTFEAVTAPRQLDGELYAILLAQDLRAATRTAFSYVSSTLEASPLLAAEIDSTTSDTIRLRNGVRIAAYSSRPAAVRGLRAKVVVLDELAFMRNAKTGLPQDREILRAVRPTMATVEGAKLVILSSPYAASGELYRLHRQHFGRDSEDVLVWQAPAPVMNPTLSDAYIARLRESDPESARAEIDAEFMAGVTTLLDPEALALVVDPDRPRELPPVSEVAYTAFCDPSGGRADAYTLAIGHLGANGSAVVDLARSWEPPFNPSGVTEEVAALLRRYRLFEVAGDAYGAEWVREAFRAEGINYTPAPLDRSRLYLELLSAVNSQRVLLPDDEALLRELRGLERRRGPQGRDRVDHPPGAHDDRANAVAGVAYRVLDGADADDLGITVGDFGGSRRELEAMHSASPEERAARQRAHDLALIAAAEGQERAAREAEARADRAASKGPHPDPGEPHPLRPTGGRRLDRGDTRRTAR